MKLKDYINFRDRGKGKTTIYQQRTQHFYDGKPIRIGNDIYPGIPANFMNNLNIPTASEIAQAQKKHFMALHRTKAQQKTLNQLASLNADGFATANQYLENMTLTAIQQLEQAIDDILINAPRRKKVQKTTSTSPTINYTALNAAYNAFKQVYNDIKQARPASAVDERFAKIDACIATADAALASSPYALLDKTLFTTSQGKSVNFISQLAYLSLSLKGVSLLEHEAINFIKQYVDLPENIIIEGTGQILVGGKQASQDALFFDKKLSIKLDSGKTVNLQEYLQSLRSGNKTISFSYNEWDSILTQGAIGLQSKYSRYGHIKMHSISLREIMAQDLKYTKALRMLYILKNQTDPDTGEKLITHPFNIKTSGQVQKHYKALFSYGLCKFMDDIMQHNHYMVTANNLIIDSNTYYQNLFNQGKYFRPSGDINLNASALNHDYRIYIQET